MILIDFSYSVKSAFSLGCQSRKMWKAYFTLCKLDYTIRSFWSWCCKTIGRLLRYPVINFLTQDTKSNEYMWFVYCGSSVEW